MRRREDEGEYEEPEETYYSAHYDWDRGWQIWLQESKPAKPPALVSVPAELAPEPSPKRQRRRKARLPRRVGNRVEVYFFTYTLHEIHDLERYVPYFCCSYIQQYTLSQRMIRRTRFDYNGAFYEE